ncbi:PREDICTED: B-box zinc finger protein 21-like [Tarenaya hassleriana]|uniref:B-box zinc finger protein 21-like n=1 Tax=Tarenaya hassleriana TaxID=28532 RepID=UPI00053C9F95|nr:PREDICTED: B-box zinc finger protein 21-like [Tarenaya hassleriana]
MKIKCDVCNKEEASVLCIADEASLCSVCDHRVHHANKLASKHLRFSLLEPSSSPLCDICQEKRALLFCVQDRAILCKDCDAPIHEANEHTKKHDRFLLTGVKLSAESCPYKCTSDSPSSPTKQDLSVPGSSISKPLIEKPAPAQHSNSKIHSSSSAKPKPRVEKSAAARSKNCGDDAAANQSGCTSTISEYLIEMLPGWHVEDLLDSPVPPFGFYQNEDGVSPYMEAEFNNSSNSHISFGSFPSENLGIRVPQIPQTLTSSYPNQYHSHDQNSNYTQIGSFKESVCSYVPTPNMKQQQGQNKRWLDDGVFTVPQITSPIHNNKKSRSFW